MDLWRLNLANSEFPVLKNGQPSPTFKVRGKNRYLAVFFRAQGSSWKMENEFDVFLRSKGGEGFGIDLRELGM
jgi:hypothetical protein